MLVKESKTKILSTVCFSIDSGWEVFGEYTIGCGIVTQSLCLIRPGLPAEYVTF